MALLTVERGAEAKEVIDFVLEECCNCGTPFMIPKRLQKQLINNQNTFYCPSGHPQSYCGKTEAQKLKEKLDLLQQESQQNEQKWMDKYLDEVSVKQKLEKQLKRVHNGVCPCCNRSFQNLKRHIDTMHPELNKK
jgi:hypothetical protein